MIEHIIILIKNSYEQHNRSRYVLASVLQDDDDDDDDDDDCLMILIVIRTVGSVRLVVYARFLMNNIRKTLALVQLFCCYYYFIVCGFMLRIHV